VYLMETHWAASIDVVDEPASLHGPPIMKSLFQSVQDEAGMRRPAHPPADDPAGIGVDDKGDIDEAGPGRDVGGRTNQRCRDTSKTRAN
jgi:hypothetical protein